MRRDEFVVCYELRARLAETMIDRAKISYEHEIAVEGTVNYRCRMFPKRNRMIGPAVCCESWANNFKLDYRPAVMAKLVRSYIERYFGSNEP